MNFKRFHESKNLTTLTEVTHDGYVKILTPTDSHLFDNIEYDTEYTLSWEITSTSTSAVYNQIRFLRSNSTSVKEINNGGSFTLTSTEMSEIVSIAFYFGRNNTNGRMYNIMLNIGSQPLPYEPYSSEVWHDTPHYIHNTATDTLTTLPADIYANDTTVTVGLKGQTVQSSTPSPTSPVIPQGCGDLETEGTKAGQYKIPILSAGQTTPVYLGEVETTRKIKKYEMTGNEDIIYQSAYSRFYFLVDDAYYSGTVRTTPCICSHYQSIHDGRTIDDVPNESIYIVTGDNNKTSFNIKTTDYTTATDFKTYLASQYAAGTPVCIWYVLAESTTGIVNEPLRKIGDYADTVSGITIPTTAGANAVDVLTTLKPSEVTVNYHGWHPVSAVHKKSKNLLAVNNTSVTVGNITLTNDNGRITITGKTTAEIYSSNAAWKNTFSFLLSAGTYYFVGANSGGVSTTIRNYSDDVSIAGNNSTFTLTNDTMVYLGFYIYQNTNNDFTVMLNTGSTPLPYEPYWT